MFDYVEFVNQNGTGGFLVPASIADEIDPLLKEKGYVRAPPEEERKPYKIENQLQKVYREYIETVEKDIVKKLRGIWKRHNEFYERMNKGGVLVDKETAEEQRDYLTCLISTSDSTWTGHSAPMKNFLESSTRSLAVKYMVLANENSIDI